MLLVNLESVSCPKVVSPTFQVHNLSQQISIRERETDGQIERQTETDRQMERDRQREWSSHLRDANVGASAADSGILQTGIV